MSEEYEISEWIYPPGFAPEDFVATGNTGKVYRDPASPHTLVNIPHSRRGDPYYRLQIAAERRVYERFKQQGGHRGLLKYYGPFEDGIRIEYAPNHGLRRYIQDNPGVSIEQRLKWCQQLADTLGFVHDSHVIHGDLCLNNVVLDNDLNAKLMDFGGSSLDGSELMVCVTDSHYCPESSYPAQSIHGDIFALGSTFYEIMAGNRPYPEFSSRDREIERRYARGEFAATDFLGPVGAVITKCWQFGYEKAIDVYNDIQGMNFKYHLARKYD